jgi:hypothetical protein
MSNRTLARTIDADILLQRKARAWFAPNPADPPKSQRLGKHCPPSKRECSRCGAGANGNPPMRDFGYRDGAIVCVRCLFREMERRDQPAPDAPQATSSPQALVDNPGIKPTRLADENADR